MTAATKYHVSYGTIVYEGHAGFFRMNRIFGPVVFFSV